MRSRIVLAGCSVVVAVGLALPAGTAAGAGRSVVLKDITFKPRALTVSKGTRVTWRWADGDTPHNVVSRGKERFKASATKTSGTHAVTFRKAGTYRYVCTIHPGMSGRIVVR